MVLGQVGGDVFVQLVLGEDGLGFGQLQPSRLAVGFDRSVIGHDVVAHDGVHTGRLLVLPQLLHGGFYFLVNLTPHVVLLGVHQVAGCLLLGLGDVAHDLNTKEADLPVESFAQGRVGAVANRGCNLCPGFEDAHQLGQPGVLHCAELGQAEKLVDRRLCPGGQPFPDILECAVEVFHRAGHSPIDIVRQRVSPEVVALEPLLETSSPQLVNARFDRVDVAEDVAGGEQAVAFAVPDIAPGHPQQVTHHVVAELKPDGVKGVLHGGSHAA